LAGIPISVNGTDSGAAEQRSEQPQPRVPAYLPELVLLLGENMFAVEPEWLAAWTKVGQRGIEESSERGGGV
jgi:hypothetical protein